MQSIMGFTQKQEPLANFNLLKNVLMVSWLACPITSKNFFIKFEFAASPLRMHHFGERAQTVLLRIRIIVYGWSNMPTHEYIVAIRTIY